MEKVSEMPYIGSDKMFNQVQMAKTISEKMYDINSLFHHFISNSWIYESN